MLIEISIKNFAIIDDIRMQFDTGFNVITGETGSGKSIIIEGLGMILGERASKELIKTGAEKTTIEGVFSVEDNKIVLELLSEYGIDVDLDKLIIITREIFSNGRSISRINGRPVTLSFLNQVTRELVDIHGQHEHQSLLDVDNQRKLLDSFGGDEVKDLLYNINQKLLEVNLEKERLKKLNIDEMEKDREIDLLKFQLEEIQRENLDSYNEKAINEEFTRLLNNKEIMATISEISNLLSYSDYNTMSLIDTLSKIEGKFSLISKYDKKIHGFSDKISELYYEMADLSREVQAYIDDYFFDEERLNILQEKIISLDNLKKKYGNTIEDILNFKEEIQERLKILMDLEKEIILIEKNIDKIEGELERLSSKLTKLRKNISKILEDNLAKELNDLNMKNVIFKINIGRLEYFTSKGLDKIEFLISTNPGEEAKLLSKIVSGGEMSRIMLAFKASLADHDNIPTLIFDEIDSGISGRTAQIVGEKIKDISKSHQVICISHLPQITALGDTHFLIDKEVKDGKSATCVKKLSKDERIVELARLLGGANVTKTTLSHAKEMLEMSN